MAWQRESAHGTEDDAPRDQTTALVALDPADRAKVAMWLHDRPSTTVRAYEREVWQMMTWVGKPLARITLADLQGYQDELTRRGLAQSSRNRAASAIKSLLTFLHREGLIPANVGVALRQRKPPDKLAERILEEAQVQRLLAKIEHPRDHALLYLLYASAVRASEAAGLKWKDALARDVAGQVTVYGKGEKTRAIVVSPATWRVLMEWKATEEAAGYGHPADPIFRGGSRGSHLSTMQIYRIVRDAARAAGIPAHVSPHWMRHAHASHALDHGAPISLVQATLGHASVQTTGRYTHARPGASSAQYLPV